MDVNIAIPQTDKERAALLRGFADAEGDITCRKYQSTMRQIGITNTNKELMDYMNMLMLSIGFNDHSYRLEGHEDRKDMYRIAISNYDDLMLWHEKVGFYLDYKAETLRKLVDSYDHERMRNQKWGRENREVIINEYRSGEKTVRELEEVYGITPSTIKRWASEDGVKSRREVAREERKRQIDEACRLYQSGMSLRQVGSRLSVDGTTIRAWLIDEGVPIRGKNR